MTTKNWHRVHVINTGALLFLYYYTIVVASGEVAETEVDTTRTDHPSADAVADFRFTVGNLLEISTDSSGNVTVLVFNDVNTKGSFHDLETNGDDHNEYYPDCGMNVVNETHDKLAIKTGNKSCIPGDVDSITNYDRVGYVPKVFYIFSIYFIFTMGLAGNVAIFVLMQLRFPGLSYSVYIRFLAVMDSLVLVYVCTEDILEHHFGKLHELKSIGGLFCPFWVYMAAMSRMASPWYVVFFTFDRFVVVIFPLKRSHFCTEKKAFLVSAVILFICASESILFGAQTRANCDIVLSGGMYWYFIVRAFALTTGLPCFLILTLNICIIGRIKRSSTFRKSFQGTQQNAKDESKISSELSVTMSLVALSLMAFCTLIPEVIVSIVRFTWLATTSGEEPTPPHIQAAHKTWPAVNLINLLNFGQNFYIIMLTSAKYRQEFLKLPLIHKLCPRRRRKDNNAPQAGYNNHSNTKKTHVSQG